MISRVVKMMKHISASGSSSYRVTIPMDFIRSLNLEECESLTLKIENEKIIIERGNK